MKFGENRLLWRFDVSESEQIHDSVASMKVNENSIFWISTKMEVSRWEKDEASTR